MVRCGRVFITASLNKGQIRVAVCAPTELRIERVAMMPQGDER